MPRRRSSSASIERRRPHDSAVAVDSSGMARPGAPKSEAVAAKPDRPSISGPSDSEFKFWSGARSGARDLNPGPHGPESHATLSSRVVFERSQFQNVVRWDRSRPDLASSYAGLLHELLHGIEVGHLLRTHGDGVSAGQFGASGPLESAQLTLPPGAALTTGLTGECAAM